MGRIPANGETTVVGADWENLINNAVSKRPAPLSAHTYRGKKWGTASKPVVVACDDGNDYVVKGRQNGRMLVNDHVIAVLGAMFDVPVGTVRLVDIPDELIQLEPDLQHMPPGISHGCQLITKCSERAWIEHVDVGDNRTRFARLAILYGWVDAYDHQLIYSQEKPYPVYSVDHGHFFAGGPNWTVGSLKSAKPAVPYDALVRGCNLTNEELQQAAEPLEDIGDENVTAAVAAACEDWWSSIGDRVVLAEYLARRKSELCSSLIQ